MAAPLPVGAEGELGGVGRFAATCSSPQGTTVGLGCELHGTVLPTGAVADSGCAMGSELTVPGLGTTTSRDSGESAMTGACAVNDGLEGTSASVREEFRLANTGIGVGLFCVGSAFGGIVTRSQGVLESDGASACSTSELLSMCCASTCANPCPGSGGVEPAFAAAADGPGAPAKFAAMPNASMALPMTPFPHMQWSCQKVATSRFRR